MKDQNDNPQPQRTPEPQPEPKPPPELPPMEPPPVEPIRYHKGGWEGTPTTNRGSGGEPSGRSEVPDL